MSWPDNPVEALRQVQVLASLAVVVSSLEFLSLASSFKPQGLYGLSTLGSSIPTMVRPTPGSRLRQLWGYPAFPGLIAVRLLCAAALFWVGTPGWPRAALLFAVAGVSLLVNLRIPFGLEGGEQLTVIVFTALALQSLFPGNSLVTFAAAWFIALQCIIAYLTAGMSKACTPEWRKGEYLSELARTDFYGHPLAARILRHRPASLAATWGIIIFEIAFIMVLGVGPLGALVILVAGVVFHLMIAALMGLNIFGLTFVATYPAIYFCSSALQKWFLTR